ncbi:nuclear transport factor 2 family protein [Dyella japonica]|uniref:nuclear transport factor 2 family protein n=1 Tax=Dyella japonica TaxID=231455 RepID=UPI0002DF2A3B|nr:nuclear transport factor 2 family protein [Dyella japonica]
MSALLLAAVMVTSMDAEPTPPSVVQAMFDAFNRHDATAMARLYASDARLASSDFCKTRTGRAEVVRTYRELFAAFPDIRDEVEQMVVQDDRVAVRFMARSDAGVLPLRLPISTFLTVRHGQILSDDSIFDTGGRPCSP